MSPGITVEPRASTTTSATCASRPRPTRAILPSSQSTVSASSTPRSSSPETSVPMFVTASVAIAVLTQPVLALRLLLPQPAQARVEPPAIHDYSHYQHLIAPRRVRHPDLHRVVVR